MRADNPDKPLGQDSQERGAEEKILHTHIEQSGNGAWCVVRVQGTEKQVAGESGLNSGLCGLSIPDFSDQYNVGILAHNGTKAIREGHADFRINLDLINASQMILKPFYKRINFGLSRVYLCQGGIQRRGFSASCWSGNQYHTVRL